MSKIQDALSRIRETKSGAIDDRARDKDEPAVARVAEKGEPERAAAPGSGPGLLLEIDQGSLRDAGMIAPDYHEQLLANQYREIKRPLIAHAFGLKATQAENGNVIMVTSALANEGKSFTSVNLAFSMAREQDYSVVLVDGDVVNPNISRIFGVSKRPGLLDILEDPSISVDDVLLPTNVAGFSLLPAGRPRHNATELLASKRMEMLIRGIRAAEPGRLVVVDSPPLLQSSESKVLAAVAGQVVLVVRAEMTAQDAVLSALDLLGEDKAVNLVLNQVREVNTEYTYGYGYGDRRGQPREGEGGATPLAQGLWER